MLLPRTGFLLALAWGSTAGQAPMSVGGVTEKAGEVRSGAIAAGADPAKAAVIGVLTGFFGQVLAGVKAPFASGVLSLIGTPAMSKGEPVGMAGASSP